MVASGQKHRCFGDFGNAFLSGGNGLGDANPTIKLGPCGFVSIVVPFFGLTNSILRIPKGNPKKELQWRL